MREANVTERTRFQPLWISILRMILGFILAWKGIVFIRDSALLEVLIERTGIGVFSKNANILSFVVSYLSLLCGLFIGSGLWTRASSIIQIPILIVAVFFVNINNVATSQFELILSIITLILLI
ncbi:MAG TPA: DoxX family membrane protein, partial [Hanamia sp.]|nr:DoxX family membrane protein [Hanamia sp.]